MPDHPDSAIEAVADALETRCCSFSDGDGSLGYGYARKEYKRVAKELLAAAYPEQTECRLPRKGPPPPPPPPKTPGTEDVGRRSYPEQTEGEPTIEFGLGQYQMEQDQSGRRGQRVTSHWEQGASQPVGGEPDERWIRRVFLPKGTVVESVNEQGEATLPERMAFVPESRLIAAEREKYDWKKLAIECDRRSKAAEQRARQGRER